MKPNAQSSTNVAKLLGDGFERHKANDLDAAMRCYRQVLKSVPTHFDALQLYATALYQSGRVAESLPWFDRAVAVDDKNATVFYNQGCAYQNLKKFDEAVRSFSKSTQLKDDYFEAHLNLGDVLYEVGAYGDALAAYNHAVRLRPFFSDVYVNRGNTLLELDRPDDAISSYRAALKIKPDNIRAHAMLGLVHAQASRVSESQSAFAAASRIAPMTLAEARIVSACLLRIGSWREAFDRCPNPVAADSQFHDEFASIEMAKISLSESPSIKIVFPPNFRPDRTVVVFADVKYARQYFAKLQESFFERHQSVNLHLHLMMANGENVHSVGVKFDPRVSLSSEFYSPKKTAGYTTRRFIRLLELLDAIDRPLLCLDIDSEFSKSVEDVFNAQCAFDVGIYERMDELFINQMIAAGMLHVSPTPGGRLFCAFLCNYFFHLEKVGKVEWFADQLGLLAAREWMVRNSSSVTFGALSRNGLAWDRSAAEAAVITYKGVRKSHGN